MHSRRLNLVWLILTGGTFLLWVVGGAHGVGTGDVPLLTVLVIAFAKVWLVGRTFMELGTAPPLLRRLFDAYVIAVPAALFALHLAAA